MRHVGKLMQLVTANTELRKCFLAVLFVASLWTGLWSSGVGRGKSEKPPSLPFPRYFSQTESLFTGYFVACENIRFSPLFAARDVSRAEERRSSARNVPSDGERGETRNGCIRRLYCLSSIHPSCILCIFAFLLICDGHAKIVLTIVWSHCLKRPGRALQNI